VKKLRVLKYGVLLGVCLFLVGASPGCKRMVNFYNNLVLNQQDFTARLACSSNTFVSDTGEYSNCQAVKSSLCNCDLYFDGEKYGSLNGCIEVQSICSGDATLLLTLDDSDEVVIATVCVNQCGDSIMDAGYFVDNYDVLMDADFLLERDEGMLELYREE